MTDLKHGGEAAVKAIERGVPFTGLAARTEQAVTDDLDQMGRVALQERNAIRAQVCLELYWSAVQKAADEGNLKALDRYVARWGWLCGVAGRSWETLDKMTRTGSKVRALDALAKDVHE